MNMRVKVFRKDCDVDDLIYLDGRIIGGYSDMLNIIISNLDIKYNFENFNKLELKGIRLILKKCKRAQREYYNKTGVTITNHRLKNKVKQHYYLDLPSAYKEPIPFENTDKAEFLREEKRDIIMIEGTVYVYGINNEYGFYNVDQDEFIPIDELEENKKFIIELLKGHEVIHYVKRRLK
jgi:hypothetical protein